MCDRIQLQIPCCVFVMLVTAAHTHLQTQSARPGLFIGADGRLPLSGSVIRNAEQAQVESKDPPNFWWESKSKQLVMIKKGKKILLMF